MGVELVRDIHHPAVIGQRRWAGFYIVDRAFNFAAEEDKQELMNMMVEHEG